MPFYACEGPGGERSLQHQLAAIVAEIDSSGHADVQRLTVLKKWFRQTGRLPAFGLWIAQRGAARGQGAAAPAGELLAQAHALLAEQGPTGARPGHNAVDTLHRRARVFQDQYRRQHWGPVRVIRDWNLLLVEQGLALYLGDRGSPTDGYRLAADDCVHYDPR